MEKKIFAKIRINKSSGQKVITIPKQKETTMWESDDLVEIRRVEVR